MPRLSVESRSNLIDAQRRAPVPRGRLPAAPASRPGRAGSPAAAAGPAFVAPQLATLVGKPPPGEGWVHEIKLDGYRLLALIDGTAVRLFTRAANDWSARFPPLLTWLGRLKVKSALIDGEAVHAGEDGRLSFHALQNALSTGRLDRLRYYAFDLLHLDGVDLRSRPLLARKALLQEMLRGAPPEIIYSDHFTEAGGTVLQHACRMALEGIVSKRAQASYRSGRNDDWLKSKCVREQELVIGGYTEQSGHPGELGALLVGYHDGDVLRFAGKVGTGFARAEGRALLERLKQARADASPFKALPAAARRGARFVAPRLVAHINFSEWTPDGKLRHPSFQGLREDKPAREVVREQEKPLAAVSPDEGTSSTPARAGKKGSPRVAGIAITHPDRVLWPDLGITKLDLARYYERIAPRLLAHAARRPISLMRCPQGDVGDCFFQRHAGKGMSAHLKEVRVEGRGDGKPYIHVDDVQGLVSLVQMGTIELHAWNATADAVHRPDRLVFDLDPGPDVPWEEVKQAARDVRANLRKLGLVSFLKTTGGKGLHVVVPFRRGPSWDAAKELARALASAMAQDAPDRFTVSSRKHARKGRIFIDYLRNDETASAVAAYSVRARAGAPVSLPIAWKQLARLESGHAFGMKQAIAQRGDPWDGMAEAAMQPLPGVRR